MAVDPRHAWMRARPGLTARRGRAGQQPFFIHLAGDAKCAARASPQTLLRNVRAPPFAGLSPPLSGQPLNRGACSSRYGSRSTPCVDDRRNRVRPGSTACRDRAGQQPFFIYLAADAKCAARASPQTLLRNVRAAPLAGLSPPLSGQPLNRGACSSSYGSRSTPCVDASARSHRLPARGRACRRAPPWRPHLSLNSWFKAA